MHTYTCVHTYIAVNLQEKSLREELAIKDSRLASYRSKVDNIDGFVREKNNWRSIAVDVSALVIHLCAAAEDCSCGPISFSATVSNLRFHTYTDIKHTYINTYIHTICL